MTKKDVVKMLQENNIVLQTILDFLAHGSVYVAIEDRIASNNDIILDLLSDEEIK